jgi:hypothetical protein
MRHKFFFNFLPISAKAFRSSHNPEKVLIAQCVNFHKFGALYSENSRFDRFELVIALSFELTITRPPQDPRPRHQAVDRHLDHLGLSSRYAFRTAASKERPPLHSERVHSKIIRKSGAQLSTGIGFTCHCYPAKKTLPTWPLAAF